MEYALISMTEVYFWPFSMLFVRRSVQNNVVPHVYPLHVGTPGQGGTRDRPWDLERDVLLVCDGWIGVEILPYSFATIYHTIQFHLHSCVHYLMHSVILLNP